MHSRNNFIHACADKSDSYPVIVRLEKVGASVTASDYEIPVSVAINGLNGLECAGIRTDNDFVAYMHVN